MEKKVKYYVNLTTMDGKGGNFDCTEDTWFYASNDDDAITYFVCNFSNIRAEMKEQQEQSRKYFKVGDTWIYDLYSSEYANADPLASCSYKWQPHDYYGYDHNEDDN